MAKRCWVVQICDRTSSSCALRPPRGGIAEPISTPRRALYVSRQRSSRPEAATSRSRLSFTYRTLFSMSSADHPRLCAIKGYFRSRCAAGGAAFRRGFPAVFIAAYPATPYLFTLTGHTMLSSYLISLNLLPGTPHIGHLSGTLSRTVLPQTGHTKIFEKDKSLPAFNAAAA